MDDDRACDSCERTENKNEKRVYARNDANNRDKVLLRRRKKKKRKTAQGGCAVRSSCRTSSDDDIRRRQETTGDTWPLNCSPQPPIYQPLYNT